MLRVVVKLHTGSDTPSSFVRSFVRSLARRAPRRADRPPISGPRRRRAHAPNGSSVSIRCTRVRLWGTSRCSPSPSIRARAWGAAPWDSPVSSRNIRRRYLLR